MTLGTRAEDFRPLPQTMNHAVAHAETQARPDSRARLSCLCTIERVHQAAFKYVRSDLTDCDYFLGNLALLAGASNFSRDASRRPNSVMYFQ